MVRSASVRRSSLASCAEYMGSGEVGLTLLQMKFTRRVTAFGVVGAGSWSGSVSGVERVAAVASGVGLVVDVSVAGSATDTEVGVAVVASACGVVSAVSSESRFGSVVATFTVSGAVGGAVLGLDDGVVATSAVSGGGVVSVGGGVGSFLSSGFLVVLDGFFGLLLEVWGAGVGSVACSGSSCWSVVASVDTAVVAAEGAGGGPAAIAAMVGAGGGVAPVAVAGAGEVGGVLVAGRWARRVMATSTPRMRTERGIGRVVRSHATADLLAMRVSWMRQRVRRSTWSPAEVVSAFVTSPSVASSGMPWSSILVACAPANDAKTCRREAPWTRPVRARRCCVASEVTAA